MFCTTLVMALSVAIGIAVVGGLVFVGVTFRRGPGVESRFARIVALWRDNLDPCGEWEIPREYGQQVFSVLDATQKYAQEK